MKYLLHSALGVFLLLIVLGVGGGIWWQNATKPVSQTEEKKSFVVTKGQGASQIANNLESKGFIKSALAFKMYVQMTDQTTDIPAGIFTLSPSFTIPEIIETFKKGPSKFPVLIREGLRREQIPDIVGKALEFDQSKINSFRQEFLTNSEAREGYLFPDTYFFAKDVTAATVISTMRTTFDTRIKEIGISQEKLKNVVILASMIERESKHKTPDESPTIAGIYMNRIDLGMPLQVDATIQYALGTQGCTGKIDCNWWPTITRDDYARSLPYSTYTNKGLPPGPISNPGLESLKAAANPKDSDYLYYIHAKDGTAYYAKTLDEHNMNVSKYLR